MSAAFQGPSIKLGGAILLDMPKEFTPDSERLMTDEKLLSAAKRMGTGSLLLCGGEFLAVDDLGLSGSFVEDPMLALGREQSAHGVYFGQMLLKSLYDYERPELVAIKPYEDTPTLAIHELGVNIHMNQTDKWARAYQPLGLWRDQDGNYSFITRYDHPVTSFDSIFWADKVEDPRALDPTIIKKALRMAMFGIGLVHGKGFSQGDPQAKNAGYDSKMIRFIDLEDARVFPADSEGTSSDIDETRHLVDKDIDIFIESCFRNPDNIGEIADAMFDIVDAMAHSYRQGVKRAHRRVGKYPMRARPSIRDLRNMINRIASTAVEAAA